MPNRAGCKSRELLRLMWSGGCTLLIAGLFWSPCTFAQTDVGTPAAVTVTQELSSIVVPIHASLAPLLPLIETQVPKTLVSKGTYEMDGQGRFGVRYRIERDAINLNQQGLGLHATTKIHYAVEACHRTWNPVAKAYAMWPCVQCGFGQPMREAIVHLHTHLAWDPDWRLRSTTTVSPAEFPNRCSVTALHVDITDWKVAPLINEELRQLARALDANTPKTTNIRAEAERVWRTIQMPIDAGSRSWVVVEPVSLGISPITGSGTTIESSLVLTAHIRLVVGEAPQIALRPLPRMQAASAANGLRIPLAVEIGYEEASRLLSSEVAGRTYRIAGHDLRVESLRLTPAGERLSIDASIDYRGGGLRDYRGVVRLEGTPQYDAATRTVSLRDLDYSLESRRRNPFVRLAERLAHDGVRESLARNARFSIATQLESSRRQVSQGLNRALTSYVTMHGNLDRLEPATIAVRPDRLSIAVVATGSASVDVR